jgi:AcrR family transcriptional regulator
VVKERLSRTRVLAAAVALADREGAEALTVRRLAEDLGVHPTSLYNHVPSKGAILDGVVAQLFAEVPPAPADVDWPGWVHHVAAGLRDLARAHPGAFMVLARRPAETPEAFALTEAGLVALERAGVPLPRALHVVRAASLAVLGLALNECPPLGEWVAPRTATTYDGYPTTARGAALPDAEDPEGAWEVLVEALVSGVRA